MSKPISVQLYSVREAMKEDVWGTLEKIAHMGYPAVEPAAVPGGDAAEAGRRISDLGMVVSAYQGGTPVGDDKNRLMDDAEALGTTHIVCPFHSPENWKSLEGVQRAADIFREAIANSAERGMTFGYHNHSFELENVLDGKPALLRMAERMPELYFTVDTYWVAHGGQDAAGVVRTLGPQANLLHIKDGPLTEGAAMTAVGAGKMDFPPIVEAGTSAKWLVVELDRCDTDMMTAVEESFNYLVASGLGHGK